MARRLMRAQSARGPSARRIATARPASTTSESVTITPMHRIAAAFAPSRRTSVLVGDAVHGAVVGAGRIGRVVARAADDRLASCAVARRPVDDGAAEVAGRRG